MAEYERVIIGPLLEGFVEIAPQSCVYVSVDRWYESPGDAIYQVASAVLELNKLCDHKESLSVRIAGRNEIVIEDAYGKRVANILVVQQGSQFALGLNVREFWEFVSKVIAAAAILALKSVAFIRGSQGEINADIVVSRNEKN